QHSPQRVGRPRPLDPHLAGEPRLERRIGVRWRQDVEQLLRTGAQVDHLSILSFTRNAPCQSPPGRVPGPAAKRRLTHSGLRYDVYRCMSRRPGMAITQRPMTLEEFLDLPEKKPALEYDDGVVTQKVSPQGQHSRLQFVIDQLINRIA